MGKRGPPPQPTALKVARGNPGKRALNHEEPSFGPATTEAPLDLGGRALEEWNRHASTLINAGVLTVCDLTGFATYCRLVGEEQEWRERVATTKGGKLKLAYHRHVLKIRDQQKAYMKEYGITPSSRSGVRAVKPTDPADERRRKFGLVGGTQKPHPA